MLDSKYAKNAFAAGAPPRTPMGELTALPQRHLVGFGGPFAEGRGMGGQEREGKGIKKMERRRWQGRGRAPETAYSR